ncbi:restriction endonuclease subunit S [Psychrobacter sp. AOP1-A1-60]|uniref:restriction endonuclease subunit S n=1 Tax=Psychrobacter sp. AOP1-A1-60 TaxID=3457727 RepID=UPI004036B735
MVSDWFDFSLGEILDITSSKRIFRSDYCESGVPFYRSKEIIEKSKGNNISTELFISEDKFEALKNKFGAPEPGDILLTSVGTLGVPYLVKNEDHFYFKDGNLTWFRNFSDQIMPKYLHLWFTSALAKRQIDEITIGSTQQALTISSLKSLMLKVPPLAQQKAIVHTLGSLDDKIELNRQMNETLEAMAQALFKSWFVDFDPVIDNALAAGNAIPDQFAERAEQRKAIKKKDNADIQSLFPDEFEFTEEMGWMPKGWEVKCIKDIGKVVTGKTPPKKIDNAYSEDGTPFITPTDIDDLPFVVYTNRYLSEDGVKAVKNSRISAGSICVTCIGSQMGKTTISPFASVSNQQINSITDCSQFWRNYLFFNLRRRREEIFHLGSSGSTMPILNKSNFEAFPILCPSEQLLSSLDSYFQGSIDSILEKTKQNQTLAKLRDTLLPKLMSGELRIPDAEKLVENI